MIKVTNIQATRIIGVLLILLSSDAFAVRAYATQDGLDTEISNRKSGDSTETARAKVAEGTLKAADTAEAARAKVAEGALKAADTALAARAEVAVGALKAADTAETARAKVAEGTLRTVIATETARAKAAESPVLIPGDSYQGGIVFWVDQTGLHGLIAAKADQSAGVLWSDTNVASAYQYNYTGTTGDGIYAGIANTTKIVAQQNALSTQASIDTSSPLTLVASAAQIADDYSIQEDGVQACTGAVSETCYGDWYLPSKVELNLLYNQKTVVGGFASTNYWSSTEYNSNYAWYQHTSGGGQYYINKDLVAFRVRAVRAF